MTNYVDDGKVWCVYDVVDTSAATTLLTSTTGLSGMEIDGVAVTLAKTYTFGTTGEHLVKFSLNNNVTSIAENQFIGVTRLKEIVAPSVITTLVQRAFKNCTGLTTIDFPNVTTIGYECFSGDTALTGELNLPALTTFAGNGEVFYNSGITGIVSLGSLADTRPQSFYGCTSLQFAILPSTITTLSQWVFRGCTSLKRVTCHATTPPSFDRAFIDCTSLSAIYVPKESVSAYRAASGWSSYASIIFPIYDSVRLNLAGLANGRWRRRLMMGCATKPADSWREYPVECWGLGNISGGTYNNYLNIVLYRFPVLSEQLKIENTSGYSCSVYTYDANMSPLRSFSVTQGGEYTLTSSEAYITVWAWDRPPLSIVDNGLLKVLYWGQPFVKPTQKPIMTGADYLWCMGNINTGITVDEAWPNCNVRTPQPIQTRNMALDLSQCSYNLKVVLINSNQARVAAPSFAAGRTYQDILASYPTAEYYTLVLWDVPPIQYARTAPFQIIFT